MHTHIVYSLVVGGGGEGGEGVEGKQRRHYSTSGKRRCYELMT